MDIFNMQLQQISLTLEIQEVQNQIQHAKHQLQIKTVQITNINSKQTHKYIQRARWSYQEDQDLLELVKQFGITSYAAIYENMPHKYKDQIYFRIRYLRNQFRLNRTCCTMNQKWFEFFLQNNQ
ncbi:SANT/Myb_domain [Hexamita inflata]|uniref:SANT/Myb domain n=1 Tax=Hexamita inflata TaxID=28002 RepID=A0AA86VA92_9EUKA|nr:SANT/Myb domain [Hexamita inflata]